jgi:hypothetical protein
LVNGFKGLPVAVLRPIVLDGAEMSRKAVDSRSKPSSDGRRRGRNQFRLTDVIRAIRSAKAGGLAIGGVEVVTKDGTTIRVLSNAAHEKRPA